MLPRINIYDVFIKKGRIGRMGRKGRIGRMGRVPLSGCSSPNPYGHPRPLPFYPSTLNDCQSRIR